MIETLHALGSRLRHSGILAGQSWFWNRVEPHWQRFFGKLSNEHGFSARINGDVFRLQYAFGARYGRQDQREYEPVFYRAFVDRVSEGLVVIDIGAHIGIFTLGAASRVGREGRVFAFEPSPDTVDILAHHVALNRCSDRVEVVRAVVSDADGVVPFYVHGLSMAASLSRDNVEALNPERVEAARRVDVPAITLDRFCSERNVRPALLKIDVEGAELRVLEGAHDLLQTGSPVILCEIHPAQMKNCGGSTAAMYAYLERLGYQATPLDAPNPVGIFHALITRIE
jgi:FkbM family methyltransferase